MPNNIYGALGPRRRPRRELRGILRDVLSPAGRAPFVTRERLQKPYALSREAQSSGAEDGFEDLTGFPGAHGLEGTPGWPPYAQMTSPADDSEVHSAGSSTPESLAHGRPRLPCWCPVLPGNSRRPEWRAFPLPQGDTRVLRNRPHRL